MSRKFDRQLKINQGILEVLEDPMTLVYLSKQLFRKPPVWMPHFVWKFFLWIVVNPATRQKNVTVTKDA